MGGFLIAEGSGDMGVGVFMSVFLGLGMGADLRLATIPSSSPLGVEGQIPLRTEPFLELDWATSTMYMQINRYSMEFSIIKCIVAS